MATTIKKICILLESRSCSRYINCQYNMGKWKLKFKDVTITVTTVTYWHCQCLARIQSISHESQYRKTKFFNCTSYVQIKKLFHWHTGQFVNLKVLHNLYSVIVVQFTIKVVVITLVTILRVKCFWSLRVNHLTKNLSALTIHRCGLSN